MVKDERIGGLQQSAATSDTPIAPVPVTDDREAHPGVWVAAMVQTNCERRVAAKLEGIGFTTYVAQQEELHRWSDRLKKVQRIVIPNIVFVKTPSTRLDELKRYSFVRTLLSHPAERRAALIPEQQIETLRLMLSQTELPVMLDGNARKLQEGEQIRIVRGCLAGFEGQVKRTNSDSLQVGIYIQDLGFAHVTINIRNIVALHPQK